MYLCRIRTSNCVIFTPIKQHNILILLIHLYMGIGTHSNGEGLCRDFFVVLWHVQDSCVIPLTIFFPRISVAVGQKQSTSLGNLWLYSFCILLEIKCSCNFQKVNAGTDLGQRIVYFLSLHFSSLISWRVLLKIKTELITLAVFIFTVSLLRFNEILLTLLLLQKDSSSQISFCWICCLFP